MAKIFLSLKQVQQLVFKNRYQVKEEKNFLSRCFEAVYDNERNLPSLTLPGGDFFELALIFATANNYGFLVNREKTYQILIDYLGGEKNFHFHEEKSFQKNNISSQGKKSFISSCIFMTDFFKKANVYNLNQEDLNFLIKKREDLLSKKKVILTNNKTVEESALLLVYGKKWSIYPYSFINILEEEEKEVPVSVLVFHQSLVDQRHKELVEQLIKDKGVELYPGCDEEYLYEVLSIEMENFLFEGLKEKYQGLPIFKIEFDEQGVFKVDEMGKII